MANFYEFVEPSLFAAVQLPFSKAMPHSLVTTTRAGETD